MVILKARVDSNSLHGPLLPDPPLALFDFCWQARLDEDWLPSLLSRQSLGRLCNTVSYYLNLPTSPALIPKLKGLTLGPVLWWSK